MLENEVSSKFRTVHELVWSRYRLVSHKQLVFDFSALRSLLVGWFRFLLEVVVLDFKPLLLLTLLAFLFLCSHVHKLNRESIVNRDWS